MINFVGIIVKYIVNKFQNKHYYLLKINFYINI